MGRRRKSVRRVSGTGSIWFHEGRQVWIGRAVVGTYPTGKPRYQQVSDPDQRKLADKLLLVRPAGDGETVGRWLTRWLAEMKVKPATRRSRTSAVKNYLATDLGHLPVAELTPRQIELAANNWPLEPASVRQTVSILSTALRDAVRAGLRSDNPARDAKKPRSPKKKIDLFTPDELKRIVAEAARRPNTRIFALLAVTGMRDGEAMALDVEDFDPKSRILSITKTLGACRELGSPKSHNSIRDIRVPDAPPQALAAIRAAVAGRTTGSLFVTSTGRRIVYRVLYVAWAALLKRLSLRYRTPHQMRHSVASHMLAAGVPVADVAAYMGDVPSTIISVYTHPTGVDAAAAMERLFRSGKPATTTKRSLENFQGDQSVMGRKRKARERQKNKRSRGM